MIFVSAPFGNYLQYTNFLKDATYVTGTFTLKPRPGRFLQILKTLRYVKTEAGWVWRNKLGLRNPGIFKGIDSTKWYNVMSRQEFQIYTDFDSYWILGSDHTQ